LNSEVCEGDGGRGDATVRVTDAIGDVVSELLMFQVSTPIVGI